MTIATLKKTIPVLVLLLALFTAPAQASRDDVRITSVGWTDVTVTSELAVAILQSLGYQVVGMTSPSQALETFREEPDSFDMLITDLTMAGLTGLELSGQVKALRSDLPIILITGYSDQVSKEEAVRSGIAEYCMKPISMRALSRVVGKFLGNGGPPTTLQQDRPN